MAETTKEKNSTKALIEVENLVKYYPVRGGVLRRVVAQVQAVDDVSFAINKGETLGLVGESGCGKSTIAHTILGLVQHTSGSVMFDGQPVFSDTGNVITKAMRRNMQIVFQDPYASLDPRLPIGESIAEGLRIHDIGTNQERFEMVMKLCSKKWGWKITTPCVTRTSSRAASARGSASPVHWYSIPNLSCWMSRFLRWMCPFKRRCSTSCAICSASWD